METSYIFTVTAGRSGQASLTNLLNSQVPGCHAVFEGPAMRLNFKGMAGDMERHFRRRFIETHELMGRGRVLTAFAAGDDSYIERVAGKRLAIINRELKRREASIYADVSKYFGRGLYRGFARLLPRFSLIRLVRDPVLNMRSFLNRDKTFTLDNSLPDAPGNLLRLDGAELTKGELYLWAWCEMYLRFDRMVDEFGVERAVDIRTEDLTDAARMEAHLDALGLAHGPITTAPPANTNTSQGYSTTEVRTDDITTFERFLARLPRHTRRRIDYLDGYDPARYRAA